MTESVAGRRDLLTLLGILALCGLLFFYKLGSVGLFDVDEAVFAEATREMVTEGDWITPHYNQENRYDKPILFYWLMGGSFSLFGISETSARLVSAVLATGLTVILYLFLRSAPLSHPVATPLIFATSLEVILLGRASITDVTLTFFISLALLSFFAAYRKGWGGGYWISYAAMALAVLTKGPVGMVIPGGIIVLFLLAVGRVREVLREMRLPSGILIFLAIATPWYFLEFQANGKEFFDAFFVKHNFSRYTGVISGHGGPIYYFIPVILLGFFPWSPFLFRPLFQSLRPAAFRVAGREARTAHLPLFAALWFSVVFLFFSLSGTKLPGYILPLFPAMALLVGWEWRGFLKGGPEGTGWGFSGIRTGTIILGGLGVLLGAGLIAVSRLLPDLEIPDTVDPVSLTGLQTGVAVLGGFFLLGTMAFLLLGRRRGAGTGMAALVVMMAATVLILTHQILPAVDRGLQGPLRDLSREAGDRVRSDGGRLAVYGINKPSIIFYSREHAAVFRRGEEEGVSRFLAEGTSVYLIVEERGLESIPPLEILARGGGYVLARAPGRGAG